ncbi:hypothetical protein [Alkalihalobacterium alkalinitrilicum]|uniref:hypothetical protein n=1 Tax=Alkalihalobacterium alkalinitrilicum TaxID=427920 RepID=UPI000994C56F|nr:hypothetical protein [Alkalihalobacterium alkalinitrilicum]
MVTLAYFLVLISIILLMTVLNMYTYSSSFIESILLLVWLEVGSRRSIVVVAASIGLFVAIAHDLHVRKKTTQHKKVRQ